jgi:hypothetical protein
MKATMNEMIADLVPAPYRYRNVEKAMAQSTRMCWKTSVDALMLWIALRTKSRPCSVNKTS